MPQKMRIFLIRHGESEANLDQGLNATLADHKISLSQRGHMQAQTAGAILARHLLDSVIPEEVALQGGKMVETESGLAITQPKTILKPVTVRFRLWQSPYLRTRQTADGVWAGIESLNNIPGIILDRREDDLLREQEYGLFDGIPDEDLPVELPREHAQYRKYEDQKGRYFARMPQGESRCDVSQRLRMFFGTVHRDREITPERQHGIENLIVVSHGVTIRCFVKEWCHKPYEWIEEEKNPGNCAIRVIENGHDLGYLHKGWRPERGHDAQEAREQGVINLDSQGHDHQPKR
jgi:2,3-bisphosphoglycerate-dependent phosphoglycerate mutase